MPSLQSQSRRGPQRSLRVVTAALTGLALAAAGSVATTAQAAASGNRPAVPASAGTRPAAGARPAASPAAAAAEPDARYPFDEGSGRTAADAEGGAPATLVSTAGWGPGIQGASALTTQPGGYARTGTVLDTTASFTVSTWVKLANTNGYQTVVSADGKIGRAHV